jgi:hypothetical protein
MNAHVEPWKQATQFRLRQMESGLIKSTGTIKFIRYRVNRLAIQFCYVRLCLGGMIRLIRLEVRAAVPCWHPLFASFTDLLCFIHCVLILRQMHKFTILQEKKEKL